MNLFLLQLCCYALLLIHFLKSFVLCFVPRRFRSKKDIKLQRILITGAGSGVGRQLAIQFSKHSTCLILLDINKESLLYTEKLLDRQSSVFIYQCDVSDRKMVYKVADTIKKEVGDVDILVNNAGIVSGKCLLDLPDEKIIKTIEVNTLGHFWMCKSFLPAMMARNKGHIVSIASILGKSGGPRLTDYCASKFAAIGFAESLELELREKDLDGIKITIVCPSHIDTGLFDGMNVIIGGVMTPEYVAEEVVAGVLQEQEIIYLPHFFKFLYMQKEIFPRWLLNWTHKESGTIRAMENFTGRTGKPNSLDSKKGL